MESFDGRVVVMHPGSLATGAVVEGKAGHHSDGGKELITGHDLLLFVASGEGTYRANGRTGILRPNTLLAASAGSFACELTEDREMYIVATRATADAPDDPHAFNPFLERQLSASDGRRWRSRMQEYADRAARGRFSVADVQHVKDAVLPYLWKHEASAAQATLQDVFASIWTHLAEPLRLDRLAHEVGYTANYLNDLARLHTGRSIGGWTTDMRMARARVALEHTDLPIADVGAACGYDDPAYFSRAFRRMHGVPPATWRIATHPEDSRYAAVTIPVEFIHEIEASAVVPTRSYSFAS